MREFHLFMNLKIKRFRYVYTVLLILFSCYIYIEKKNYYLDKMDVVLKLKEELDEVDVEYDQEIVMELKNEEVSKIVIDDNEFIKAIYYFSNYTSTKLIDASRPIIKESDDYFEKVYVVFKLEGNLYSLYNFMQLIFLSEIFIDNSETYLLLNGDYFEISLGYYRERL